MAEMAVASRKLSYKEVKFLGVVRRNKNVRLGVRGIRNEKTVAQNYISYFFN